MPDLLDWEEEILPRLAERSIPTFAVFHSARLLELDDNRFLVWFPTEASFHCRLAREMGAYLQELLFDLTGRKPGLLSRVGDPNVDAQPQEDG